MSVKKYYVSANTAEGFIRHLEPNLHLINHTISLKHPSFKKNSAILQGIIEKNKQKTDIEILKSPLSDEYLEGVILREKQIAVINQTPILTGRFEDAYSYFATGLKVHDDIEKIYIGEMDFEKADRLAESLINELLGNVPKITREPRVYRRFFGTNTIDGVVNEVPNLISSLDMVYHIKGREGTGKSTFMRKIADACINHGFDIELYQCSFDPSSLDMVLVPELSICLFDSTDPHAFLPADSEREKIIDLYEVAVTPGTDEKYKEDITKLTKEYKSYMKKGLQVLKETGKQIINENEVRNPSSEEIEAEINDIQSTINER